MAKASLDKALASAAVRDVCDVEVHWRPFFLRPQRLEDPSCREGIVPGTKGTPAGPYWHGFNEKARTYGIDMSGGVKRFPFVLYSHRLLEYAEKTGGWRVQHDLAGRIFKAYYSQGIYLGPENLAKLAELVGLDHDVVLAYLRSDENEAEVKREGLSWKGIGGVPYSFINGRPAFSGCQDPATFANAIVAATQQLCPGDEVKIAGLANAAELNGKCGVLEAFNAHSKRWHVDLGGEGIKAVREENVILAA